MIRFFFSILFIGTPFLYPFVFQGDIADQIAQFFKTANTKEISKNFAPAVELSVNDNEDSYSKAQAEQILRDFLIKNPPVNALVVHQINTNPNYRFLVLSLITKNDKFRIAVTLKKSINTFFITELRIEPEK